MMQEKRPEKKMSTGRTQESLQYSGTAVNKKNEMHPRQWRHTHQEYNLRKVCSINVDYAYTEGQSLHPFPFTAQTPQYDNSFSSLRLSDSAPPPSTARPRRRHIQRLV